MQFILDAVDRTFGRRSRHSLGLSAALTVAAIMARLADEASAASKQIGAKAAAARMAADYAAMHANTDTLPVITSWADPTIGIGHVAIIRDGHFVDPEITQPISRAELLAAIECDGGRPMHELDFAQVTGGGAR